MPMTAKDARDRNWQALVGVVLAACIISAWALAHIGGVFFYEWGPHSFITAPLLIALSCWLYVGLFIVAHDCMHGSLVPFRPAWNKVVGQHVRSAGSDNELQQQLWPLPVSREANSTGHLERDQR